MANVKLDNMSIDFPIYSSKNLSLRNMVADKMVGGNFWKNKASYEVVRALDRISFEVNAGDRVGLVGHNGSGKSTLLRAIAGIYPLTSGTLEIQGKISTLFGTSVGMNEEMTGYENLFLNSLLFSHDFKLVKKELENMAEFTGLGKYLTLPMSTYSEGMKVRVAFASATHFDPEILLIDEVFGAGDKDFTEKSSKRMSNLIDKSHILFLASHSEALISEFCNKAIYLSKGQLVGFGEVNEILEMYRNSH